MSKPIKLAVFGDTHGHMRLMLQLCRLWQVNNDVHLDGILQCGDFGYFPDVSRIDKSTRAYAKRDSEELGFAEYFSNEATSNDPLVESIFDGPADDLNTITCPIFFCHGNHEDFDLLEEAIGDDELPAVDRYNRFRYLRSGHATEIRGIRIGALGGGPERKGEPSDPLVGQSVSVTAAKLLTNKPIDVLLCHCAPSGIGGESNEWGSDAIRKVIGETKPEYCFFAHHKKEIKPASIGPTKCVWHNDVNFKRLASNQNLGQVEAKCMGALTIDGESNYSYEHVDSPWFKAITGANWQYF